MYTYYTTENKNINLLEMKKDKYLFSN